MIAQGHYVIEGVESKVISSTIAGTATYEPHIEPVNRFAIPWPEHLKPLDRLMHNDTKEYLRDETSG